MMMHSYDENLEENPIFEILKTKHKGLYENATSQRFTICIPQKNSYQKQFIHDFNPETHILHSVDDQTYDFLTLDNKEIHASSGFLRTGNGFSDTKQVKILFEETYFNEADESFKVLCVDQPLEGRTLHNIIQPTPSVTSLHSIDDSTEYLWGHGGSQRSKQRIDRLISDLNVKGQPLRQIIDLTGALLSASLQIVLKDNYLGKQRRHDKYYLDNLKLALEAYILHNVHDKVFNCISVLVSPDDAALNKINRNLAELQIRDVGVNTALCDNVPQARRTLCNLNHYKTPLEKAHCVKKAILILMTRKKLSATVSLNDITLTMSADDLIPILVFLVVRTSIANWIANIVYMRHFSYVSSQEMSEYGYYLTSLEAAVEHVKSGSMSSVSDPQSIQFRRNSSFAAFQILPSWYSIDNDINHTVIRLLEHIEEGDCSSVEGMLAEAATDQKTIAEQMCHPLCSCDNCEKLISGIKSDPNKVTVFSRDDRGCTALHVAALADQDNIVSVLIDKGADVDAINYFGSTPLHLACQRGHQKILILLLSEGASINVTDNDSNTPLHLASANGHDDCVKALLFSSRKVNINCGNSAGDTALHIASRWGYVAIINNLLELGATVEAVNRRKETPIDCAHNVNVGEILRLAFENTEMKNNHGFVSVDVIPQNISSPMRSNSELTRVHDDFTDKQQQQILMPAQIQMIKLEKVMKAVGNNDLPMVKYLFGWLADSDSSEDEADGNESSNKLCHPLCQCDNCRGHHKKSSSLTDINVNTCNESGFTVLHLACLKGYTKMAQMLIRKGTNLNCKTLGQQCTPLSLACQSDQKQVVSLLIDNGAKVGMKDSTSKTPLHVSCANGHLECSGILLKGGAAPNPADTKGNTPLHYAARCGHLPVVKLLIANGASVRLRNKSQLTPLQYTQNDQIMKLLEVSEEDETFSELETTISQPQCPPSEPVASPVKHVSVRELFRLFGDDELKKVQQLAHSIQTFDRLNYLRKTTTRDNSMPKIDEDIKTTPSERPTGDEVACSSTENNS